MNLPNLSGQAPREGEAERAMQRMTRRSFTIGGIAALAGVGGWYWLRTRPDAAGIPWPLRSALDFNARLAEGYFKGTRLAPTFPAEQAEEPRPNGGLGITQDLDPRRWRLQVETPSRNDARTFTLDDIKALPRVDMVTELRCIEGWSTVVAWTGARFVDFAHAYRLATRSGDALDPARQPHDLFPYVQMETPDGGYYVGLDMASALHPQTLLCYAMNGQALTPVHGAPLRLVITVKYGIKSIKRIGRIRFLDQRPADYWAERGYDWYSGH
jgi:DMSO/TMAO reductase YedYZ molybdopterin-dependent catalytic subunit